MVLLYTKKSEKYSHYDSFKFARSQFHMVLNMPLVLNMPGLCKVVNMWGTHRVLNMPEEAWICLNYYFIMCEYVLIMLHMLEYACIYLNKQSSNVFDAVCAVYSIRSLYKSLSSYRDREIYSEHSQTFNKNNIV